MARPVLTGFVRTLVFLFRGQFSQFRAVCLKALRTICAANTTECFLFTKEVMQRASSSGVVRVVAAWQQKGSMWSTRCCPEALACHSSPWQQPTDDVTQGAQDFWRRLFSAYTCASVWVCIGCYMKLKCRTDWIISIICKMHLPMGLPHSCAFADKHQCKEEAQKWRWSRSDSGSVSLPWTRCL